MIQAMRYSSSNIHLVLREWTYYAKSDIEIYLPAMWL